MRTVIFAFALAIIPIIPFSAAHAQKERHGMITAIQPIDNRGSDETNTTKFKRKMGGLVGRLGGIFAASHTGQGASLVGQAAPAAGQVAGEKVGEKIGDQGPAAHYMVKLKMDSGKILPTVQEAPALNGLHVGSRVTVADTARGIHLSKD